MTAFFFFYGAAALWAQIVLLREVASCVVQHETSLSAALAMWLFWSGLGSFSWREGVINKSSLEIRFAVVLISNFISGLISLYALHWIRGNFPFGTTPGLFAIITIPFLVFALPGFTFGKLFAYAARWAEGHASARFYFAEGLGAFIAGISTTFYLLPRFSPLQILVFGGSTLAAGYLILIPQKIIQKKSWAVFFALILLCGSAALIFKLKAIENFLRQTAWKRYQIIAERESPYGKLTFAKLGEQTLFFEQGILAARFPDPALAEELVHWPLLLHGAPKNILILGGAAPAKFKELLKYPINELVWVDPDKNKVELFQKYLPEIDLKLISHPKVKTIIADGRQTLKNYPQHFDCIIQLYSEPANAALNRYFTLEFFNEVKASLKVKGIYAFSIPSAENYLAPAPLYFDSSIYQTLKAAFPNCLIVPGQMITLLASEKKYSLDIDLLSRNYAERKINNVALVPATFPYILHPFRVSLIEGALAKMKEVPLNRDFYPVSYFYLWKMWLVKFVSPKYFLGIAALFFLGLFVLVEIFRARRQFLKHPSILIVFGVGMCGFSAEIVLLFLFQSLSGALYWQMGILFAAFMAGLSLGSGVGNIILIYQKRLLRSLFIINSAIMAISLLFLSNHLDSLRNYQGNMLLILISALIALVGFFVGFIYPCAVSEWDQNEADGGVERLYSYDLWGSALGGLLAGAFLVPLYGFSCTLYTAGVILLVALMGYGVVYFFRYRLSI